MPLDEKSREEKEAYASKIMAEMKLKNEKLKERYKEVQRDRERAEERNSSITIGRNLRKDENKDFSPKMKSEREWDRGKPDMDTVDWDSKHHEYYPPKNSRVYSDRRDRRNDNWRSRGNPSRPTSSFFSNYHSNKNETESSPHGNRSSYRPRSHHYSNSTRNTNDSQPYHNSKVEDYSPKVSSTPDMKRENAPRRSDELMWQSGSMIEAQIKFNRIENWVKSINENHGFAENTNVKNIKEDYKSHSRGKDLTFREKPKKFCMNEDITNKKSKDQGYFIRSEELVGQSIAYNTSTGRKRIRERVSSASDSKNCKDVKRKNSTDRPRKTCESEMTDHASSIKESDTIILYGSKSDNFPEEDKKVDGNIQDPWGSDIPNNGNAKDFFYSDGDEAWEDWGTDTKPNSQQLKNKTEYGTKPSQYSSKTKTRQNEKFNMTESKYELDSLSRNGEDSSKRPLHKRSENVSHFRSTASRVSASSNLNPVQVDYDGNWDPVGVESNQEEFTEEWKSEAPKENFEIPSQSEHCNSEVLVNQSSSTLDSSINKETSCLQQDRSYEVKGNLKREKNNIESIEVNSIDHSKFSNLNSSVEEKQFNYSIELNKHSGSNSRWAESDKFMINDCDRTYDKEVSQSDSEFQKADYCNESSYSNSQLVNCDGSSGGTSKSVGNMDQLDFKSSSERDTNEEIVPINENLLSHYKKSKNEQVPEAEIESAIVSVDLKLQTEHSAQDSNDTCEIPVFDEKVMVDSRGEPEGNVRNSDDDDGWSTVTDE